MGSALPLWASHGVDPETGACFEAINLETVSGTGSTCRARVVPRQIYSFLEGTRLGWTGPGAVIATALFDWYLDTYLLDDGFYAASADRVDQVTDTTFDLYNQAFSLFGFAQVAAALPGRRDIAAKHATDLLNRLRDTLRHSEAGFREAVPDRLPLRSNPHMHLFEACLAWEGVSDDPVWRDLADEIAELALTRFIDPVSGGLREYFGPDWAPFNGDEGRTMEPGHQFEWAWLLAGWGRSRGDAGALIAARRLYDIAWTYGIDESRGVAFMALNSDFTVRDPLARLWGQTEWIKAAIALAQVSTGPERAAYLSDLTEAVGALRVFLDSAPEGLWQDKLSPDGSFVSEPAPASSLYHIVCAIAELNAFARSL
ncbi:AGE family epimerase/isomerase [Roseibium sp.]|uniref:AGE family epimerase/isomerase n=1 Tax=Roseibium sp. TaxID=1936156 RepID=UPI00326726AA